MKAILTIDKGIDDYGIEKIQELEKLYEDALGNIGLTLNGSTKESNKTSFHFAQFAFESQEEK